jgi:hypothetical protein
MSPELSMSEIKTKLEFQIPGSLSSYEFEGHSVAEYELGGI